MRIVNKKYSKMNSLKNLFLNQKPFPYLVLDNFLENNLFKKINLEIDSIDKKNLLKLEGKFYKTSVERNKWISKNLNLPRNMKKVLHFLNSKIWISNLEQLSQIKNLTGTKILNKNISNFHTMSKNGFLGSHVDHSADPSTGYPHVMNIIIFLTKNWKSNFGGNTLFYNSNGTKIIKEIVYKPNRAVIFLHTPYSFHGVSKIKNNKLVKRSTIYIDYFCESQKPFEHLKLQFSNKWFLHDTCFKLDSKIEYFKPSNIYYLKSNIKYFLSKYFK
jgi:hypothetical protein